MRALQHKLVLSVIVLLLTSCGQQHDAESVVKKFMQENIEDASSLNITDLSKIDSTRHLNDSIIKSMRANVDESRIYKKGIKYPAENPSKKLFIVRVNYRIKENNYCDTYYIDEGLTKVMALKTIPL